MSPTLREKQKIANLQLKYRLPTQEPWRPGIAVFQPAMGLPPFGRLLPLGIAVFQPAMELPPFGRLLPLGIAVFQPAMGLPPFGRLPVRGDPSKSVTP